MENERMTVLVVDDATENIDIIIGLLRDDYKVKVATNGLKAMKIVESGNLPDLILLDIMMPEMDGYEVIQKLKANPDTRHIPVIFLTGKTDATDETKGFEMGAVDYISKPFNQLVVKARVKTHIELVRQRRKTEQLLENILPRQVITELRETGVSKPSVFKNVTVLFSDFVDFTERSATMEVELLINELSEIFTKFDEIIERNDCERIKTIGDAYLAVCGMPQEDPLHAEKMVRSAIEMIDYLKARNLESGENWESRVGIHSGQVVGGIVGIKKYIYDIFGDTVNTASRVEAASSPLRITVSQATYDLVTTTFSFSSRGMVDLKGKGETGLYYVEH